MCVLRVVLPCPAASMNRVDQSSISLLELVQILRRRVVLIALFVLGLLALALAVSLSQQKQYSAAASLLFRDPQLDQKLLGSTFVAPSTDPTREAATNLKLVSLPVVAKRTQRRLPRVGSVVDKVEVNADGQADLVSIRATDPSPTTAAHIANAFGEEYIAFRRQADRAKIRDAQQLASRQLNALSERERSGPNGRSIRQRSEQLQILASLQTGNAELVERATPPPSPSSPKVLRNAVLGGLLGLILGSALAFLLEHFDRRIRDPKEMENIFQRPILGTIPDSRAIATSGPVLEGSFSESEAFRMLRANLRYFNVDRDIESVLITSSAPAEGKSTVAWNLASAAAGAGAKALLIEADLRHPRLASAVQLHPQRGLSSVLSGEAEVDQAVQHVPVSESSNGTGPARALDVLFAGPLPPNPSDLLESERMEKVLRAAERAYDLVVIDTPPTSVVPDAIPLVGRVGGVIVVCRLGRTIRGAVTHLRNQLENLDAPIIGVVVNAVTSASGYGYGYGYDYDYGPGRGPTGPSDAPLGRFTRRRHEQGAKRSGNDVGESTAASLPNIPADPDGTTATDPRTTRPNR